MTENGRLPWFPCYPTKLLAALAQMPPAEQLVYLVMLLRIYEGGGFCPDTIDAIARRVGHNKRIVSDALNNLFEAGRLRRDADGIHNPVADGVIAETKARREGRIESGRKGGVATAKKTLKNQIEGASKARVLLPAKSSYLHLQLEESLFPNGNKAPDVKNGTTEEAELFRRGKEILGPNAGGFIKRVLKAKGGSIPQTKAAIELASEKNDPREYLGGVIRAGKRNHDDTVDGRL